MLCSKKRNMVKIKLGPLLGVESESELSICILIDSSTYRENATVQLVVKYDEKKERLDGHCIEDSAYLFELRFYKFTLSIESLQYADFTYSFEIDNEVIYDLHRRNSFSVQLNKPNKTPSIAYVSCTGSHKGVNKIKKTDYYGYKVLLDQKPDYLFFGGDQVYADQLLINKKSLYRQYYLSDNSNLNSKQKEFVKRFYLELYINSWNNEYLSLALATIPNVMTWDDHDIIDGYGSHAQFIAKKHKELFQIAKVYYEYFQLRMGKVGTRILPLNNHLFVLPETRANRTEKTIVSEDDYEKMNNYLKTNDDKYYNICFVLPVPIAHMNYTSAFEKMFRFITKLFKSKRLSALHHDDVVDHWAHSYHIEDEKKMMDTIFNFGDYFEPKYLSIVSGDVHSSGASKITRKIGSRTNYATQIVSSPIVNKAVIWMTALHHIFARGNRKTGVYHFEMKKWGSYWRRNIYKRSFVITKDVPDNPNNSENERKPFLVAKISYEVTPNNWLTNSYQQFRSLNKFQK